MHPLGSPSAGLRAGQVLGAAARSESTGTTSTPPGARRGEPDPESVAGHGVDGPTPSSPIRSIEPLVPTHYDRPMTPTDALLEVSSAWPELRAAPGDVVVAEGASSERLLVLVDGALEVRRDGEVVAILDRPGACIGEMALLLGTEHSADVIATASSTLWVLDDARAALRTDAALLGPVAAILASRLRLVTASLADLKRQSSDSGTGLGMVSEVLTSLSQHQGFRMEPGSERE